MRRGLVGYWLAEICEADPQVTIKYRIRVEKFRKISNPTVIARPGLPDLLVKIFHQIHARKLINQVQSRVFTLLLHIIYKLQHCTKLLISFYTIVFTIYCYGPGNIFLY
jgi:hypothetical protein